MGVGVRVGSGVRVGVRVLVTVAVRLGMGVTLGVGVEENANGPEEQEVRTIMKITAMGNFNCIE